MGGGPAAIVGNLAEIRQFALGERLEDLEYLRARHRREGGDEGRIQEHLPEAVILHDGRLSPGKALRNQAWSAYLLYWEAWNAWETRHWSRMSALPIATIVRGPTRSDGNSSGD